MVIPPCKCLGIELEKASFGRLRGRRGKIEIVLQPMQRTKFWEGFVYIYSKSDDDIPSYQKKYYRIINASSSSKTPIVGVIEKIEERALEIGAVLEDFIEGT